MIPDIWTNQAMEDFLARAALILNKFERQEFSVLAKKQMKGNHTAESIKIANIAEANSRNLELEELRI